MAFSHPLLVMSLSYPPVKQDLTLWCGTTFVHTLSLSNIYQNNIKRLKSYPMTALTKKSIKEHDVYCYNLLLSDSIDFFELKIRPKSPDKSKLNSPFLELTFTDRGAISDDRPLPLKNTLFPKIWIDANVTAQMLHLEYDYELVAVTTSGVCAQNYGGSYPVSDLANVNLELNDDEFFSYRTVLLYGTLFAKQVGAIL